MEVQVFNPDDHMDHICEWLKLRNLPYSLGEQLPEIGFMAFEGGQAICAGFLRKVEGDFAMLDSLITNPEALNYLRSNAIDAVVRELIKAAKAWGISSLIATSTDAHTLERSKKHGFVAMPDTVIALEL